MQKKDEDGQDFDSCFWTLIYLLLSDDDLLSFKGKVLKELMSCGGYSKSITYLSKCKKTSLSTMHNVLQKFEEKGIVCFEKCGRNKSIKIREKIITKALEMPHSILGEND